MQQSMLQLCFLVTFDTHAVFLYCTDEGCCPAPAQGYKHVFWYCIGVYSVLLIIKASHMLFASPQEPHLTLKCCISSLRCRAWKWGVPALPVAMQHSNWQTRPLPIGGRQHGDPTNQSGSNSCREYVSRSQIQPAFLWFIFLSCENCVKHIILKYLSFL